MPLQVFSGQTANQVPLQILSGGDAYSQHAAVQAETTTLLAAMTVQPDLSRKFLIDDMIVSLKGAGLWPILDLLFVLAAHDAQAGRINWKNPATIAAANAGPIFTVDRGYAGDGVAAYLGTGIQLNALGHFTQNDCSLGIYVTNNAQAGGTTSLIGLTTTNRIFLLPRSSSDSMIIRLMGTTSSLSAMTDSRGHSLATRSAATGYDRYKNGVLIDNVVIASTATLAEEIVLLRNQALYSSSQILSLAHLGSSLTPAQIANLYSIIRVYMTGVGA